MRLTTSELSAWAEPVYKSFAEKLTWTRVANDSDFRGVTISMQRTRNEVDAQIVVNVARTRGLDPLEQLGKIPRWNHLARARSLPTPIEVVASLNPAHIFRELSDRLLVQTPVNINLGPWENYHARMSSWIDVAGPEDAREIIRVALKLRTSSTLSGKLNSRAKFDVDEVIDGFTAAEMDPVYALVLAGKLTPSEVGYPDKLREDALLAISDEDLIYLSQKQLRYTSRLLMENRLSQEHLRKLQ